MVENHVGDGGDVGNDEDTDDLSVTLMEVWAGGQYAQFSRTCFLRPLFFVFQQFAQLTYNYDFLAAGGRAGINFVLIKRTAAGCSEKKQTQWNGFIAVCLLAVFIFIRVDQRAKKLPVHSVLEKALN